MLAVVVRLVGPNQAVEILGIKLVGVNADNGRKLLFTVVFVAVVVVLGSLLGRLARAALRDRGKERGEFWTRQAIRLATAAVLVVGLASIWFDDPTRLATALGLVTAGLAFALQKVVTAIAGYVVILRGKTFNVGDRIVMGGVRGDVIALGFTQTTIMEMGQPPPVQQAEPPIWVQSRQYTGRVVTVSNARIFDEPVYNYTRDFPYLWEELGIAIPYAADRHRAEQLLLDVARRHTIALSDLGAEALREMQRRYLLKPAEIGPSVYYRLTDNALEMTVRFVVAEHGVRECKNAMSRDLLAGLEEAGIPLAATTLAITAFPALRVESGASGTPDVDARRRAS
jgi:small-conductance mechanosensitive channel